MEYLYLHEDDLKIDILLRPAESLLFILTLTFSCLLLASTLLVSDSKLLADDALAREGTSRVLEPLYRIDMLPWEGWMVVSRKGSGDSSKFLSSVHRYSYKQIPLIL